MSIADKSQWCPHTCTECGWPAYIPFSGPAKCVYMLCPRYDEETYNKHFQEVLQKAGFTEEEDTDPQLSLPGTAAPFDWRDFVLSHTPTNTGATDHWVYALPKGEAGRVHAGDELRDVFGRVFRVTKVDRSLDEITVSIFYQRITHPGEGIVLTDVDDCDKMSLCESTTPAMKSAKQQAGPSLGSLDHLSDTYRLAYTANIEMGQPKLTPGSNTHPAPSGGKQSDYTRRNCWIVMSREWDEE